MQTSIVLRVCETYVKLRSIYAELYTIEKHSVNYYGSHFKLMVSRFIDVQ
jgi:hypothetical protein